MSDLTNIQIISTFAEMANVHSPSSTTNTNQALNGNIQFQPCQMLQVFADVEIQECVVDAVITSPTNVRVGLYKYDRSGDKLVLKASWSGAGATGAVTYSLSSPVTLTSGTYFMGVSADSVAVFYSSTNDQYA